MSEDREILFSLLMIMEDVFKGELWVPEECDKEFFEDTIDAFIKYKKELVNWIFEMELDTLDEDEEPRPPIMIEDDIYDAIEEIIKEAKRKCGKELAEKLQDKVDKAF